MFRVKNTKIYSKLPPFSSRNRCPFLVPNCSTNIVEFSAEYRRLDEFKTVTSFDFFFDSLTKLKKKNLIE